MINRNIKAIFACLLIFLLSFPLFAVVESEDSTTVIYQEVFSSPDYLVTTGDVYSLSYNALGSVVNYTIVVDPTYRVRVSNLGIIDAKGKTFLELKEEVEEIVSSNYPMSAVQLVLSVPSTFKITVRGEVDTVREMKVSGLVRVSAVVYGNAKSNASLRFVTVEDADGNVNRYDLFLAQRFGDMSQNPYVRPNDIITLEKADRKVSVTGSVERPGTYELLEGENLKTLVDYYGGGFDELADTDSIILSRDLSSISKSGQVSYLTERDYRNDISLLNLDTVYVGSKAELTKTMFVQGAISSGSGDMVEQSTDPTINPLMSRSASFRFEDGESYAYFARTHRSLFSSVADYDNAYVYRNGKAIAIDLYSMVFDPEYDSHLTLQADDILVVPFKQYFVTVTGAVEVPGRYPYIPDRTWEYYVNLAGGYDKSRNNPETLEIRTVDGKVLSTDDYILPETTITAPSNLRVIIGGEVTKNQEITIGSSLTRLSAVVAPYRTSYSSIRFVTLKDKDGNVKRYDFFLMDRFGDQSQDPYVKDGDVITVERSDRKVSITGSVERPGTYELLERENLKTLIDYYGGGFDELADTDNIILSRDLSSISKSGQVSYLTERDYKNDISLLNLDTVYVGSKSDLTKTIFVQGALATGSGDMVEQSTEPTINPLMSRSASFKFEDGESYVHFARTHRGLFSDVADYNGAYVYRNGKTIAIDLYSMVFNPEYDDSLTLQADDILVVPFKQSFVTVTGAVEVPGRYPYIPDRTWEYYVNLAGGYDKSRNSPETLEIRTVEGKLLSTDDYILPETTITAPSNLRVIIGGEVTKNQEITIGSSLTRLSSVVSGYRTSYSSIRFVTVKDKDGNVNRYDFFLMDRFGDLSQDPYVKDGDVITVERAGRKVSISGSVERPGTYELLEGENLKTLIDYYGGGLDPLADTTNITLTRKLSDNNKAGEIQYLDETVLVDDFELVHLDSVSIGNLSDLRNTIFIQGAVGIQISETTEGEVPTKNIRYQFEEGETYLKFVRSHKSWFTDVSDYERSYVSRKGTRISINLYSMLFDPEYEDDLKMEADDILIVPFKQFFVTVSGAVKVPGRYAYVPDRTWEYYVGLAGGFDPDLNVRDKISMTTNDGGKLSKSDYILPETTIDAARNSFGYNFNKYATPILTILSMLTSTIVIYTFFTNR